MKMIQCDMCGVSTPAGSTYIQVESINYMPTIGQGPDTSKQFCSALCVATYHARACGKEVK